MAHSPSPIAHRPLVSVIIVNYNAGKLLIQAVKSVLKLEGVEVVVADNASRDTSFRDLQDKIKSKKLITIDNGANLGFGRAVNGAVAKSRGEYVYLLNPDASLKATALMRMVETAKSYNNRAVVAPRLENPDGSAQPSCYPKQTFWNALREYWLGVVGAYSKYLPRGNKPRPVYAAVAAAWLVPRAIWDELGGLSDRFFLYFEDLDFCDRAHQLGIHIIYDPLAVVTHHHGVSSRTNPIVLKLFTQSAWAYHGPLKKLAIDMLIRIRDFFVPPASPKKLLLIVLAQGILLTAISALGYTLLTSRMSPSLLVPSLYQHNFLLWSPANFDGEHYLRIASSGYQTILGQSEYAFFPLYPLLIKLASLTGVSAYLAARIINFFALLGFAYFVTKWAARYTNNPLSILWLTLLSPGAIFLTAIYTEPLFLLLAAATFYYSDRGEWSRALLATMFATATRVTGLCLVIFLFAKMTSHRARALLGLSGLAAYMAYLMAATGNPLAWFSAQAGWGKSQATWPWETASTYLTAITTEFHPDLTHLVVAIEVLVTLVLLSLLIVSYRRRTLPPPYQLYSLAALALPLATGSLGSMPRFLLTLFPLFLIIQRLPKFPRLVIIYSFLIIVCIGVVLFTRGYWYA